jgi:hypothetical protein
MVQDKLSIASEMAALDTKDRGFYDSLSDEEKKKFSTFLMIRYGSSVQGNDEMQAYYLQATNQRLNKDFFSINKRHDKLNWLAVTTISPGMGKQHHQWIAAPKKATSNNKVEKFLANLYPSAKPDDIGLLASINELADIKKLAEEMGMSKEQIKKELG